MKRIVITMLLASILICCNPSPSKREIEQWKSEIIDTEKEFNDLAQKEGLARAFQTFAAQDAAINRENEIINGKDAIERYYQKRDNPNETLIWKPDFVDVGSSGDLGYTYGSFTYTSKDSMGVERKSIGKFHTVWKKQTDGTWKFVWD